MIVILAAGIFLGYLLCMAAIRQGRKGTRAKRAKPDTPAAKRAEAETAGPKRFETSKLIVWICLVNGFLWIWCSYLLAWFDKSQIAESLSQVAVTEIIGVVFAHCAKTVLENLSKNNRWPDKGNADEPDDSAGAG